MDKYTKVDSETATLQALYTFPYLIAEQVTRLLFSPGSRKSAVNPLLKRLHEKQDMVAHSVKTQK